MKKIFLCTFLVFLCTFTLLGLACSEEEKEQTRFSIDTQELGGDYDYSDARGVQLKGKQQISQYRLNYHPDKQWNIGLIMQVNRTSKLDPIKSPFPEGGYADSNGHRMSMGARVDYRLNKSDSWDTTLVLAYSDLPVSLYNYSGNKREVLELEHNLLLLGLASQYKVSPRFTLCGEVGISPGNFKVDGRLKKVDGTTDIDNFDYQAKAQSWLLKGKYKLDEKFTLTLGYRYLKIKGDVNSRWINGPIEETAKNWILGLDIELK